MKRKDILVSISVQDILSEEMVTSITNEKTIFIKTQDLFRFFRISGFNYEILTLHKLPY